MGGSFLHRSDDKNATQISSLTGRQCYRCRDNRLIMHANGICMNACLEVACVRFDGILALGTRSLLRLECLNVLVLIPVVAQHGIAWPA